MQLEVPKDQYEKAVETMANKIRKGKVPGISDPNEASNLIRKGHITYEQARSITKFGTVESITYDISECVIIGTVTGGISFGITALIFYINTEDANTALRIAAVQAGKTFGNTITIYVTTQQLHRLSAVQGLLSRIEIGKVSPTVRDFLQNGIGVDSISGINKALRGTLVTSAVVIAVTTGPDMIKLMRGRISQAQFLKNLALVSSGVAGGFIGAFAGGTLLSPLGPVGAIVGRTAGGIIGGVVASAISNKIANKLMEEDRVKMLCIIQVQMEYLATVFILTSDEIENLNSNLDKIVNQRTLEIIYSAKGSRRAMTNFFIKTVVVSVIKQRPALSYKADKIIEAFNEVIN